MKVTLYTIPDDVYCKQAKDYLTSKAIVFDEKDVKADKDNLSEMLAASDKFAGVPFCVVLKDNGEKAVLKGFTQADYDAVLGGGEDVAPAESGVAPAVDVMPAVDAMPVAPVAPAEMPSAMPVMPMEPAMPSTTSPTSQAPVPAAPVMDMGMPAMPMSSAPAPVEPIAPVAPVAPAVPPQDMPADPQAELNGLLKDLEAKVGNVPVAPVATTPMSPTAPATVAMPDLPQSQ